MQLGLINQSRLIRMASALVLTFALAATLQTFAGSSLADLTRFDPARMNPDFIAHLDASQTVPLEVNDLTGMAYFWFAGSRQHPELHYLIKVNGLDLDGFVTCSLPVNGCDVNATGDDVTKIHLHEAPVGETGPHVLNIFKAPRQDDRDLIVWAAEGWLRGVWDDGDENLLMPPTTKLTDAAEALCTGNVYVNIHSNDFPAGAIRGQVMPSSSICRGLGKDR